MVGDGGWGIGDGRGTPIYTLEWYVFIEPPNCARSKLVFMGYSLLSIVTMYGLIFGRTIHHQKMLWVQKVKPAALVAQTLGSTNTW